jgi:hypothetical protein
MFGFDRPSFAGDRRVWRDDGSLLKAHLKVAAYNPAVAAFWGDRTSAVVDLTEGRIKTSRDQGPASQNSLRGRWRNFVVCGFECRSAQRVRPLPWLAAHRGWLAQRLWRQRTFTLTLHTDMLPDVLRRLAMYTLVQGYRHG